MTAENFTPRFPFRVRATTTEITEHKFVIYAEDEKEARSLARLYAPAEGGDVVESIFRLTSVKIED